MINIVPAGLYRETLSQNEKKENDVLKKESNPRVGIAHNIKYFLCLKYLRSKLLYSLFLHLKSSQTKLEGIVSSLKNKINMNIHKNSTIL